MKPPADDELPAREVAGRERRVLTHFLTTKPKEHKPLGKNAQSRRRARERRKAKKSA